MEGDNWARLNWEPVSEERYATATTFRPNDEIKMSISKLIFIGLLFLGCQARGENVMKQDPQKFMPNLIEELSYSTVRITCILTNGVTSVGTGFVMAFKFDAEKGSFLPVLITNKHVVRGSQKIAFVLTEMVEGRPSNGRCSFDLPINEQAWKMHPDPNVDLCALPIGTLINDVRANNKNVKLTWLSTDIIATNDQIDKMRQLDEVVMIGYPDGIADHVNNQPIFRRGTFATNPTLDYNGNKDFVVDIAAFNGSSGSPVFVKYDAARFDADHASIVVGRRPTVALVGVLYAGFHHKIDGRIVPIQVPTSVVPISVSAVPNNLGIVLKAQRITELESLF